MSRCLACCQENCGYGPCSCSCHVFHLVEVPDRWPPCKDCGLSGAHFCPGKKPRDEIRWELERKLDLEAFKMLDGPPKCKKHRQYRAIRRPRTACEACWRLWIALHPA